MAREEEKLKLGKGAAFVKGRFKRLPAGGNLGGGLPGAAQADHAGRCTPSHRIGRPQKQALHKAIADFAEESAASCSISGVLYLKFPELRLCYGMTYQLHRKGNQQWRN